MLLRLFKFLTRKELKLLKELGPVTDSHPPFTISRFLFSWEYFEPRIWTFGCAVGGGTFCFWLFPAQYRHMQENRRHKNREQFCIIDCIFCAGLVSGTIGICASIISMQFLITVPIIGGLALLQYLS